MSVDHGEAFTVSTYRLLVEQVARLAYLNKDYMLFFRGQKRRRFRNKLVHQPKTIELEEIYKFIETIKFLIGDLSSSISKSK